MSRFGTRALVLGLLSGLFLIGVVPASALAETTNTPVSEMFPSNLRATPIPGGAHVEWDAVDYIGVKSLMGGFTAPAIADEYYVTSSYDPTTNSGYRICRVKAPQTSCDITGLVNGASYTFTARTGTRVIALPGPGYVGDFPEWSRFSPPSDVVSPCCGVPGAVSDAQAQAVGSQFDVTWAPPGDWGGAQELTYEVTSAPAGLVCTTKATSCALEGAQYATAYTFSVTARNASAAGPTIITNTSTLTPTVPGSSGAGTAAYRKNGSAVVRWQAPTQTGGSPITGYVVTAKPGGRSCTTSGTTTCQVSGLIPGTSYSFTVRAKNRLGTGSASPAIVAGRLITPASRPQRVSTSATSTSAVIRWEAPASSGGGRIIEYVVREGSRVFCAGLERACTIARLAAGSTHTFSIVAVNTSGSGRPATTTVTIPVPVYTPPPPPVQPGPKLQAPVN